MNRAAVIGQLKQTAGACFATLRARRELGEADEVAAHLIKARRNFRHISE
jgi:hypothetical protein